MNQNDKRNAKISEVCRVLANACSSGNTNLYPEDVMTFVNESRNSDIRELLALHMALNKIDAIKRLDKSLECAEAWHYYTRPLRRNGRRVVVRYPGHYSEAQIQDDFETAFAYLETMDALVLESEIEEYEKLLKAEQDSPFYTDNEIAANTCAEIRTAKFVREIEISRIATEAYMKEIKYVTIIRFMREKLSSDEERALFLSKYADAAHSAGLDYHFM